MEFQRADGEEVRIGRRAGGVGVEDGEVFAEFVGGGGNVERAV